MINRLISTVNLAEVARYLARNFVPPGQHLQKIAKLGKSITHGKLYRNTHKLKATIFSIDEFIWSKFSAHDLDLGLKYRLKVIFLKPR